MPRDQPPQHPGYCCIDTCAVTRRRELHIQNSIPSSPVSRACTHMRCASIRHPADTARRPDHLVRGSPRQAKTGQSRSWRVNKHVTGPDKPPVCLLTEACNRQNRQKSQKGQPGRPARAWARHTGSVTVCQLRQPCMSAGLGAGKTARRQGLGDQQSTATFHQA